MNCFLPTVLPESTGNRGGVEFAAPESVTVEVVEVNRDEVGDSQSADCGLRLRVERLNRVFLACLQARQELDQARLSVGVDCTRNNCRSSYEAVPNVDSRNCWRVGSKKKSL